MPAHPTARRLAVNGVPLCLFESGTPDPTRGPVLLAHGIPTVPVPVLVVRAMAPGSARDLMDFRYSPTWPGLAAAFPHGRELHLPDRTHFLPMEDPALVARWILDD